MKIKIVNLEEKILWLLTTFLFASFYIFDSYSWGKYILAASAVIVFGAGVLVHQRGKLHLALKPFHGFLAVFGFYSLLSSLWAWNQSAALTMSSTIFQILLCYSLIMWYYGQFDSVKPLINCIMWGGFAIAIYTFVSYGGYAKIMEMVRSAKRLGNEYANVNSIAMVCAVACVIQLYKVWDTKRVASAIFAIPAIIMIAACQSRKAILVLILGVLATVVLKNYNPKKLVKSLLKLLAVLIVAVVFLKLLLSLDIFAGLNKRMDGMIAGLSGEGKADSSTSTRNLYIQIGLRQFAKTPFFGIGIGSSGNLLLTETGHATYLHNNFVELLACGGIVGFVLYYAMYAYLAYNLLKLRRYQKTETELCLIILGIILIMDYGMVSYYDKSQYFYLMLCFIQTEILKKKRRDHQNALAEAFEKRN